MRSVSPRWKPKSKMMAQIHEGKPKSTKYEERSKPIRLEDFWTLGLCRSIHFGGSYLLIQPLDPAVIWCPYVRGYYVYLVQISESSNHWNVHYLSDDSSFLSSFSFFSFLLSLMLHSPPLCYPLTTLYLLLFSHNISAWFLLLK